MPPRVRRRPNRYVGCSVALAVRPVEDGIRCRLRSAATLRKNPAPGPFPSGRGPLPSSFWPGLSGCPSIQVVHADGTRGSDRHDRIPLRYNRVRNMRSSWWLAAFIFAFVPTLAFGQIGMGPPSILPQCLDPGPATIGIGPSARARECTRQFCAEPEYREKVTAYAKSRPQSEPDQKEALTCITRWEQDQRKQ